MNAGGRGLAGLLVAGCLAAGALWLLRQGIYGLSIFVILPIALGGLSTWVTRPATPGRAAGIGALAVAGATLLALGLGLEGLICVIMMWPIALPLGALGALLFYKPSPSYSPGRGLAMLLLVPGGLAWDTTAKPPVFEVQSAVEIAAPPETVWKHVVTFSELPPPKEWYFRAGIAYPERARIEGSGPGAVRYCEFSTGPFVEPIRVWDEPRLLQFDVTANPAPMHEWSPYAEVLPKHLHGYFVSKQGQFRLIPLGKGRTRLEGTTWYQHGLWPAQYWRWWSDAIIHRIHLRVLEHIQMLAETESGQR